MESFREVMRAPNPSRMLIYVLLALLVASLTVSGAAGAAASATVRSTATGADPDNGITGGFVERWSGARWLLQRGVSGPGNPLYGVSCPSARTCVAVGASIERWNGRIWSRLRGGRLAYGWSPTFTAVSCRSASACIAVGYEQTSGKSHPGGIVLPLAERWDGRSWGVILPRVPRHSGDSSLAAVSCPSIRLCMAVGSWHFGAHRLAERWNGRRWRIVPTVDDGTAGGFTAVSCQSGNDCVAVGGGVARWAGARWLNEQNPSPDAELSGVSCLRSTDCVAVGARYPTPTSIFDVPRNPPVAELWDGTSWSLPPAQPPAGPTGDRVLTTVSCAAGACFAAGGNYGASMLRWNGASWAELPFGHVKGATEQEFTSVSCSSTLACAAVGYYYG